MRLVGNCPEHGWVGVDDALGGTGRASVTRVKVECPICGRGIWAADAFYTSTASDDDTTLSPNSLASSAQLRRLKSALEWAEREVTREGVDPEEVRRKLTNAIERESPALVRALNAALSGRGVAVATWIMVLIMLVDMFISHSQPPVLTRDDIVQIIDQIEKHHETPPADDPGIGRGRNPASDH